MLWRKSAAHVAALVAVVATSTVMRSDVGRAAADRQSPVAPVAVSHPSNGPTEALRQATAARIAAEVEMYRAQLEVDRLVSERARLDKHIADIDAALFNGNQRLADLTAQTDDASDQLALFRLAGALGAAIPLRRQPVPGYAGDVEEVEATIAAGRTAALSAAAAERDTARGLVESAASVRHERDVVDVQLASARTALDQSRLRLSAAFDAERHAQREPTLAEPASLATSVGVPDRVMQILLHTESLMGSERPRCGIGWPLLAAISRIEGDHGRYGGARMGDDGVVSPAIVGVALDGEGVAYIADSDHGAYDGDAALDRAVGPFQFIPTTWSLYGRDATGDGVADPNNYRDAALSAASYLCAAGGDLRTASGEERAVLAYNASTVYLADVRALAARYRVAAERAATGPAPTGPAPGGPAAAGAPLGPLPTTAVTSGEDPRRTPR